MKTNNANFEMSESSKLFFRIKRLIHKEIAINKQSIINNMSLRTDGLFIK